MTNRKHEVHYLSHHGVERKDEPSTPIQVVFNASAHDNGSPSLNILLEIGPKTHADKLKMNLLILAKDLNYAEKYIQEYISNGYAFKGSTNEKVTPGKVWYLLHHGVTSLNKPDKVRVVFNCSAKLQVLKEPECCVTTQHGFVN